MARKFSKNSKTWQTYEALFLVEGEPDEFNEETQRFEPAPQRFTDLTKGQAVNMAQLLNSAQRQDFQEKGIGLDQITKSAKAKPMPGHEACDSGDYTTKCWMLEVSVSYRHRGKPGKADDAMGKVLNQALQNSNNLSPLARIAQMAQGKTLAPLPDAQVVKPPISDDLFADMFGIKKPE